MIEEFTAKEGITIEDILIGKDFDNSIKEITINTEVCKIKTTVIKDGDVILMLYRVIGFPHSHDPKIHTHPGFNF